MKEVTLKIPEKKLGFFMELIKQLGIEVSTEAEIPEEHNNKDSKINWRFKNKDARIKLKRLYPKIND